MQFLIDTATDSPQELYKIGRFLVDQFETVPAPSHEAGGDTLGQDAGAATKDGPLPPPPPPVTFTGIIDTSPVGDDTDPDVDVDEAQNVTAVTVSTELPVTVYGTTTTEGSGPLVDSAGVAWSAALHTSTKSKTIDGRWKPRKPRDAPPPPPPPAVVATMEAQNKPGNVPPPPPAPPSSAAPSAAIGSAAPSTGIATTPLDFRGLMQKIQKATADGKLAAEQVNAALAGVGLKPEEMAQLINNAPLIASVNAAIDSCLS